MITRFAVVFWINSSKLYLAAPCAITSCLKLVLLIPNFTANHPITYTVVSRKRAHEQSTLQVCQRGGWALFRLFLHLTTKERPRHVYSDSKLSKQIMGQKITYKESPVASKSSPEGTQHSEQHDVTVSIV